MPYLRQSACTSRRYSRRRYSDSALGLYRLDEKRRELSGAKLFLDARDVSEGNRFGLGQQRAESFPPERIVHQRQSAASQPVKRALAIEQRIAFGGRARELDRGLDALAPRAGEEDLLQVAACQLAQSLGQLACQFRNMTLQHRRTAAIQLILQRLNDPRVIVPGVVHAISGQKVQVAVAVFAEQLDAGTALVAHVHVEQFQQAHPLWIHELRVTGTAGNGALGHE